VARASTLVAFAPLSQTPQLNGRVWPRSSRRCSIIPGVANEWIGLLGVVVGGAIGSFSTYLTSKRSTEQVERVASAGNKNQRTMAREAREHDRLAGAYVQLLGMTEPIGQWAQQVNPMYRPNPDRPLPDLDKQAGVVAGMRAYGSEEVVEAFEA
jgi:hypothetical protein